MALVRQPNTAGFRLKSRYDIFIRRPSKCLNQTQWFNIVLFGFHDSGSYQQKLHDVWHKILEVWRAWQGVTFQANLLLLQRIWVCCAHWLRYGTSSIKQTNTDSQIENKYQNTLGTGPRIYTWENMHRVLGYAYIHPTKILVLWPWEPKQWAIFVSQLF